MGQRRREKIKLTHKPGLLFLVTNLCPHQQGEEEAAAMNPWLTL